MMRLAEFLLRWTQDSKYADYWEQNLHNGIMAQSYWKRSLSFSDKSDMPSKGLLTYFLPMSHSSLKDWATETESFFCCHGTLVQSNALMSRGMYYQDNKKLYVCQYFDSDAKVRINGCDVLIEQKCDSMAGSFHFDSTSQGRQTITPVTVDVPHNPDCHVANLRITTSEDISFSLLLRIPYWVKGEPEIYLNGTAIKDSQTDSKGFISLSNVWKNGDVVRLVFPMGITMSTIPGNDKLAAFHYGPLTLAGLCENAGTLKLPKNPEDFLVHDNEREWGSWKSTFRTVGQDKNIRFVPLKEIGYEPYTVYFDVEV
jgi:DUF1680 family protein